MNRVAMMSLALLACATPAAAGPSLVSQQGGWHLEVLVNGVPAPTYAHGGETWVLGRAGERYVLRVHNRTGRRVEAVVSVDGRDVIDGKPADPGKRGYLVPAWGHVDIDGWRLSERQAAAFRFSSVARSYAARMGNARNVGVIGLAVFPERSAPRPWPIAPRPRYSYEDDALGAPADRSASKGEAQSAPPAAAPSAAGRGGVAEAESARRRPGLGTEFGEATHSPIREVHFVRASSSPAAVLELRYNDRAGLVAIGIDVDGYYHAGDDSWLRQTATPFPSGRFAAPPPGWTRR